MNPENHRQVTEPSMRLDKWLKIARIIKTRSQATLACDQGRIKVNDQVAKPAKLVKIGDTIAVKTKWRTRTFDILGIVQKNVRAEEARLLYREHELTPEEKEAEDIRSLFYQAAKSQRPKYKGRPTKKERREMEKFRGRLDKD
ncbi:MAG: RNA-binding S4 domain-containing protein [candidate division KSB1 bacterium]|nr:RNA-binding S4 domain-containing protein [candidate division KSB1 bacterium]MDZ7318383.1 RNA-binding S4 domain-containing protein [candidate division KSB1 bacterium]MDZ7341004.1 RNA-binding S4 domain-containing protein [candidate division KSB1 bacterium]